MKSMFKWNKPQKTIIKDLGVNQKLNLFMAQECMRLMEPFVPMDTGVLSQTVETKADDQCGIVHYLVPYAHRQYTGEEFNFSTEKHKLATHHWDKAMLIAKKKQLIRTVDKYREGLAK